MALLDWFRRRDPEPEPVDLAPPGAGLRVDASEDGDLGAELAATLTAVRAAGGDLPGAAWSRLRVVVDLLAPLVEHVRERGVSPEQSVLLHSVTGEYLRDPLEAYLRVARAERRPGSRADALLEQQLEVLESAVRDLDATVRSGSLAELDLHGRFVAERFMVSELEGR